MPKIIRCAIYIRVSSSEQVMHGHSLEAQVNYLTEYAQERNWKIIGVFADEGKTARKELKRRKAIKELLKCVEADQVDMILFWKMDRWFRNVADFYKVQDVLDAHNCKWTAAAEPSMNLETREGRLNVNIMLTINQNETDTTSERIKFVNQSSVTKGKAIVGTPSMPLGYKVEKVDGVKRVIKDPEKEAIVCDFFEHILATHNKTKSIRYINEKYNDIVVSPMKAWNMLRCSLYIGQYRDNLQYCEPYLTIDQWNEIQFINQNNVKVYSSYGEHSDNPYIFTSMIFCPECGRRMSGMRRRKKTYYLKYYRCPSHYTTMKCSYGKVLNERTLESYLLKNVEALFHQSLQSPDISSHSPNPKNNIVSVDHLEKELDRLNSMYQKGRISESRYDEEYGKIEKFISTAKLEACPPIPRAKYSPAEIKHLFKEGWQDEYLQLSIANRRSFWLSIIERINPRTDTGAVESISFLI